jgi:hypothetical protein
MTLWTCLVCRRVERSEEPPEGWATGWASFCGAACFRSEYSGMQVAHLFPAHATEAEMALLRQHEDVMLRRCIERSNPKMIGALAGSFFRQREERAAQRTGRQ